VEEDLVDVVVTAEIAEVEVVEIDIRSSHSTPLIPFPFPL
jgi:hypothetical protein